MAYEIWMHDHSYLLDWSAPVGQKWFYPFDRPVFTKGEAMVDMTLLNALYRQRVSELPGSPGKDKDEVVYANDGFSAAEIVNSDHLPDWTNDIHLSSTAGEVFGDVGGLAHNGSGAWSSQVNDFLASAIPVGSQVFGIEGGNVGKTIIHALEQNLILADNINPMDRDSLDGMVSNYTSVSSNTLSTPQPRGNNISKAKVDGGTVVVGGLALQHLALVVCGSDDDEITDFPVAIRSIDVPATEAGLLVAPAELKPSAPPPILLLSPSSPHADLAVLGTPLTKSSDVVRIATETFSGGLAQTSTLSGYVLKGQPVDDLFGIPGLRGEVYSYQSADPEAPVRETVKPDLGSLLSDVGPIAFLFPDMSGDPVKRIPLEKIEFTYSEELDIFKNPAGLRLNADVAFTGPLEPVSDLLNFLFEGSGDPRNKKPEKLHVSARLGPQRDWSRPLTDNLGTNFTLQGSVDTSVWLGEIFHFRKVGVEVTVVRQMATYRAEEKPDKAVSGGNTEPAKWDLGYGLFGELNIHGIPGTAGLSLTAQYHLKKFGDTYALQMALSSEAWTGIFGIEKLSVSPFNPYSHLFMA